ncbi:hypothetical protein [Kitasatospora sp. NBC_01266]|nr:hypothetical protein [Kitasatospora sp. NBC_01266]
MIWAGLEACPGFTRQWAATVQRIRGHLELQAIGLPAHSYQGG